MKQLVITADDFGAAYEVNEAIEMAHRSGVLTAASLMVTGHAAADAVTRARRAPSLRVGLHVVLVEGCPLLPASAVSCLVDDHGMFLSDMPALGAIVAFSPKARSQLAAEISAQFEAFRATGLTLDHCNAHKHFHLHPVIGAMIAAIGVRFGLQAVRVPLEPRAVLRKVEATARLPSLTAPLSVLLRRHLRSVGMLVPDQVFGLKWSGQMTRRRLAGLIANLPAGLSEIYLHPATGAFEGAAVGYRYREELDALMDCEIIAACREPSLRLGGFGDFSSARAPRASTEAPASNPRALAP